MKFQIKRCNSFFFYQNDKYHTCGTKHSGPDVFLQLKLPSEKKKQTPKQIKLVIQKEVVMLPRITKLAVKKFKVGMCSCHTYGTY